MAIKLRGRILYLDFRCYLPDRRKIRCTESTGLRDNPKNRKIADAKDKAITYHLKHGKFNYLEFFPQGSKAKHFKRPVSEILFSDWWQQWIESQSVRPNSLAGRISRYDTHIGPLFGHMPISEIDETSILIFRYQLESQGFKASYVNMIIKTLCSALLKAHKQGLLPAYPCEDIRRLAETQPDIDPFSFHELRYFLSSLEDSWYDLVFLWSRTGLRSGEMCAIKWKHVDYFNRKLMIRETRNNSGIEGPPKTRQSIRDVDLRQPAIDTLRRQEARTGLQDGHIWLNQAGQPWTPVQLQQKFRYLLRRPKLKYRSPKQMRHTFATLAIAAGENISWVSQMLGHSDITITARRYNRYVPNLTRDDGSALEKLMNGDENEKRQFK